MDIKSALKKHSLTQKEVAERMGITHIALNQHINGNPSVAVLERIAGAIGCDVAEFFESPGQQLTCPHCGKPITIRVE